MATLKSVYTALKAHGYTGADGDAQALAKFALDNEIEVKGKDGQAIDIAALAPAKVAKKAVTIEPEAQAPAKDEPKPDVGEAVQKAIAEFEARVVKGFEFKRPDLSEVSVGKSGDERRYDTKIKSGKAKFKSFEEADAFAGWFYSRVGMARGNQDMARKSWAKFGEFATRKGFVGNTMESGGALVPDYFEPNLQNLVLQYGVARQLARVVRTNTDNYARPRVTGDLGVYYPGEGSAMTDSSSSRTFDQIKGTVKTGTVLAKMSKQISEDSAIDIMEDTIESIARAIAILEDQTLFNGTGAGAGSPSTYIPGVRGITDIIGLITSDDSRSEAGATTATAHTIGDVTSFMAKANAYAGSNWAFVCSNEFACACLFRLAQSQGGVTFQEFVNMGPTPYALGFPVVRTPVLNRNMTTATAGTVDCIFGDISLAATFVERQGIEIDVSDQRYWDELNIGVRGVVRHDINVHDLGSTSAQGPISFLHQT